MCFSHQVFFLCNIVSYQNEYSLRVWLAFDGSCRGMHAQKWFKPAPEAFGVCDIDYR